VIVVIGRLTGSAAGVARRIAARGGAVELVAPVQPDSSGDRSLTEVAAAGVRHAAVLRTAAAALEPADVELALRYLPEIGVIVLADDASSLSAVATDAAAWSSAPLIVVAEANAADRLPGDPAAASRTIVLERPATDPDEAFAGLVAALAIRLEAGDDGIRAFDAVRRELAVDPVRSSSDRPPR
jgi:hypothetical protein